MKIFKNSVTISLISVLATVVSFAGQIIVARNSSVIPKPSASVCVMTFIIALMLEILIFSFNGCIIAKYSSRLNTFNFALLLFFSAVFLNSFRQITVYDSQIAYRYSILAPIIAIGLIFELFFRKKEIVKESNCFSQRFVEYAFAFICFVIGIIVIVLSEPRTLICWDDGMHFEQSLYLTQGIYSVASEAEIKEIFMEAPAKLEELISLDSSRIMLTNAEAFLPERFAHIGSTIGLWMGRLIGAPFNVVFKLGKATNLALYIIVIFCAMRRLESGKVFFATISLMPTMVFLASNYSCDAFVTSFIALSMAYFIGSIQRKDEKITTREIINIFSAMIIGTLQKPPYAFLTMLFLCLPREKFVNEKQRKWFISFAFLTIIVVFFYTFARSFIIGGIEDTRGGDNVNAVEQVKYILSDIPNFLRLLFTRIGKWLNPRNAYEYISNFYNLGSYKIGSWLLIPLIASAFIGNNIEISRKIKMWTLAVCFAQLLIIATIFYIVYTPVGTDEIYGCQSRYIYPVLYPMLLITFAGVVPKIKNEIISRNSKIQSR